MKTPTLPHLLKSPSWGTEPFTHRRKVLQIQTVAGTMLGSSPYAYATPMATVSQGSWHTCITFLPCYKKLSQTCWLKIMSIHSFRVLETRGQNQGPCRARPVWRLRAKHATSPLPALLPSGHPWCSLAHKCTPAVSAFVFT